MRRSKRTFGFSVLSLCLVTLMFGVSQTFGQATSGTISGTVVDPAGNVVSGATVTARNTDTGVSASSITTTNDGTFVFSNLRPGTYSVTTSTPSGFKTKTITEVAVRLGVDTPLRIDLEVGGAAETVTIVAGADEIAQTNSEITPILTGARFQNFRQMPQALELTRWR